MQFKRKLAAVRRNTIGKPYRGFLDLRRLIDRLDDGYLADLVENGFDLVLRGATTPSNTVMANPIYLPAAVIANSNQVVNQGDMVRWDGVNYTLVPLTDPSQVPFIPGGNYGYIGVAQGTANPNVYPAPAAGVPSENLPGVVVQRGGSVKLKSIAGEGSYFPFEPVTVASVAQGGDAQTVTRLGQSNANRVGFVIVHPPANAPGTPGATPAPATAPSGQSVEVWVEPKFPGTYLL